MHLDNKKDIDLRERIDDVINELVKHQFDGCIAGSAALDEDFNLWESEPDVDFFAYSEESWIYTVSTLLGNGNRFEPATAKDTWKLERISQGRNRTGNKFNTQTIYIKDTNNEIYLNLSYKPGTSNILDVLARFDTVAIMVGICCRTHKVVDLRKSFHNISYLPPHSNDGRANPIRLWYLAEGWDEETWGRQLARIKKYAARGFNMTGMVMDLLEVASRVLNRGEVVGSDKSKARYLNLMLSCYRPILWMEEWLGTKEHPEKILSEEVFNEILTMICDLPEEMQLSILDDLSLPFEPDKDKIFESDEEEEEDATTDDR